MGGIRPPHVHPERLRRIWIHWRREEDGGVLLLTGGRLARLNRVAADVWEEIDRAADRQILHRRMRRRYRDVHDATLRAEVDALLDSWLEEGWIARVADPVFPSEEREWERPSMPF